jgi:hypothetical protein
VSNVSAGNIKDGVSIGGVEGTYDPMAAAVFPAEANVEVAETAYGPTGAEYAGALDLAAAEAAAASDQLATDKAAVTAAAASIKDDTTILTIPGTYDFTAAIAAGYADGEAAQLATDQAEVEAVKASILDTVTGLLGTVDGTIDTSVIVVGNIRYGVTIVGVTGEYRGACPVVTA